MNACLNIVEWAARHSMVSLECCCMHVKLAHRKQRQEHLEFKVNLGYRGILLKQVFAVREPLQGFSAS